MTIRKSGRLRDNRVGLLLVLPAVVIFSAIILYPLLAAVCMSFTDKSLIKPAAAFIGIENYVQLFKDNNFPGLFINTLIFVFFSTALSFILGFIWAIILNTKFHFAELFRGITLVNWIFPGVAIGYLWIFIFHGEYGFVNGFLGLLGIINRNINWPGQMNTAMAVVITARVWSMMPFNMAFILGGLQGVSIDQLEAARIDGSGNIRSFFHVVLPGMKGIISLILILGSISNLQSFDLIYIMTAGGPARATTTFAIEVYRNAFKFYNLGYASAIGIIWALLLGVISILYIRQIRGTEE